MATVSVIVPAYNAEAFLSRAICSVEAQRFRDFEVVVNDDVRRAADELVSWMGRTPRTA